jgi:hypothetical protein
MLCMMVDRQHEIDADADPGGVVDLSRKARDGKSKPRSRRPIDRGDYLIGAQTGKLIADENVRCATEKPP